jgi:hypothetical protein
VFTSLVGAAWPATVTVSKPGGGGTYTAVQAGINAAGANGTVTILDSQTYIEDVTIGPTQSNILIQAAAGQHPTIEAANAVNRYASFGFDSPADHWGLAVQAPCTLVGLKIKNPSPQVSHHATLGVGLASAVFIHGSGVVLRNCQIIGPGVPAVPGGELEGCMVMAFSTTPSSVSLENCEIYSTEVAVNLATGRVLVAGAADCRLRMTNCYLHDCLGDVCLMSAGTLTAANCRFLNNAKGMEIGGGTALLTGCDFVDNVEWGLGLYWCGENVGRTNYPQVTATNCLFARNGASQSAIEIETGFLTLDHSIVSSSGDSCISMGYGTIKASGLNVESCDIFGPGTTCVSFDTTAGIHSSVSIKNSILYGHDGVLSLPPFRTNVCYSSVSVQPGGTRFQNTLTSYPSNNVEIPPQYVSPNAGTRSGFRYHNGNLNVGEGGRDIGSQGRAPAAVFRRWTSYN